MGFNSGFKGLTLILLTWRKWWAPNNASKQQMGFNSAFKGLTIKSIYSSAGYYLESHLKNVRN